MHKVNQTKRPIQVTLLDESSQRRAEITHELSKRQCHVEPFEDIEELKSYWPATGTFFIHDNGENVQRVLAEMENGRPYIPTVAYSEQPSAEGVADLVLQGAVDYFTLPGSFDELPARLDRAMERSQRYHRMMQEGWKAKRVLNMLSTREVEVLRHLAMGETNKGIGKILNISPRTVEIHRCNLISKIGAKHSNEAIRLAFASGLAS